MRFEEVGGGVTLSPTPLSHHSTRYAPDRTTDRNRCFTYRFITCDLTSESGPDDEIDDDDLLLCQCKRRKICSASK